MKKVFVSSVITGFESYRQAVKATVVSMDFKPIMSEDFSSRAYSSETACISEVEKSDLVLLVMGAKYGFKTSEGISVTHAEYRAARAAKKPVLAFLQEGELEAEQEAFKREVEKYDDGLFRAKFSTPDQLKDLVVKSIRNWESEGQTTNAEGFAKRLDQILPQISSSRNEPRAVVAFWGQPAVEVDLDVIEQNADEIFNQLCKTGAAALRDGYNTVSKPDHVMFKSGKTEFSCYADGLILLNFSAEPKSDGHSFAFFYVSPQIFSSVATRARTLNTSRIVWALVGLYGMDSRYFDEPTKGNSSSVPMYNQSSEHFVKLFSPITEAAYEEWIGMQVKRLKRTFSKK